MERFLLSTPEREALIGAGNCRPVKLSARSRTCLMTGPGDVRFDTFKIQLV